MLKIQMTQTNASYFKFGNSNFGFVSDFAIRVLNFLCVAVLYLLLQSQFIAIIQVIVYAGAIVMLIVFVIMLLDLEEELRSGLTLFYSKVIGSALAVLFLIGIIYSVAAAPLTGKTGPYTPEEVSANVKT